jgi:hypothetical protein
MQIMVECAVCPEVLAGLPEPASFLRIAFILLERFVPAMGYSPQPGPIPIAYGFSLTARRVP